MVKYLLLHYWFSVLSWIAVKKRIVFPREKQVENREEGGHNLNLTVHPNLGDQCIKRTEQRREIKRR